MLASPADWFSPGSQRVARPEDRPACRRRQEGQPARHRPRLRRRRRPEVGLEGVPAGPQRAVHGPLRRPRLGADPRRPGRGRARRRGAPPGDGARASYAMRIDLAASRPAGELASTGYCLAVPGRSTWSICPTAARRRWTSRPRRASCPWSGCTRSRARSHAGEAVEGGKRRTFKAPFDGDAVLYLRKMP